MAVPSNRVPVRVARGLKSALVSNLGDLLEGELLYAKDEDKLYMVESGVLVAMGADLAASSIGDLSDVTLTSAAVGEVLRYNGSAWVDAQLDYSDLSGTPTLGTAAAADTADFATAAQGATADSAVQPTDSIDVLADVDTTTAAPTASQVLTWNGSNWAPADAGGGAVDSVNGQTGAVVLDLENLDNVKSIGGTVYFYDTYVNSSSNVNSAGKYYKQGFVSPDRELVYVYGTDANGNDISTEVAGATTGTDIWWKSDTVTTWQASTLYSNASGSGPSSTCTFTINEPPSVTTGAIGVGNIYLTFVDPLGGPSDGQVLTYVTANNQWEPTTPAAGGVTSIIAGTNITIDPVGGTGDVTINATGGGGGGGAIQTSFTTESQTASGGAATFSGIGQSGQLVNVTSSLAAWIVLYPTAAARTADAGRAYGTDPTPGSGVLAEFYVGAGGTVLATPGTTYFNNDTTKASAIYAAVRDQAGANVDSEVTLGCYAASGVIGYRATVSATTASLADGAAGDVTFSNTGKSGRFVSLETDRAAWVTLYDSTASRTADSGRAEGTDPGNGTGVLAEVITTGAQTVKLTPTLGYFNDEATPVSELYAKVVNKSGATSTVQVDITLVPAEV